MATAEMSALVEEIRKKIGELKGLCHGLDEATASRQPSGNWSVKQVLSHLWGAEGVGYLPTFQAYLEKDNPRLDIDPGNPFFTGARSRLTVAELMAGVEEEYRRIGEFALGLAPGQLARKAHIPMLKESPLGEYPTLGQWLGGLGSFHLGTHVAHIRETLAAVGAPPKQ